MTRRVSLGAGVETVEGVEVPLGADDTYVSLGRSGND